MDSWKHEDRLSPGCEGLLSSRTLWCWDHDRIFVSRPNKQFLGFASWTESTNTWPKCQKKFWLQALRTEVQGNLSRRLNHGQSRLERCLMCLLFIVNENGLTLIQENSVQVGLKCQLYSSQWSIEVWITFLAKGGGPKKRFQYCLNPNFSKHFFYFWAIQGHSGGTSRWTYIARQCIFTKWLRRVHLPHRERSRHALHRAGRMGSRRKVSKGTGSQCFSQPWIRCTPIKIWKKFSRIWTTPELRCTKILESSAKYSILVQSEVFKEKDCSSIIPVARNRSFKHTTCELYWESGIQEDWRGLILQST